MQKSSIHIAVACLIVLSLYSLTQIVFLNFYDAYKIPFGRSDVENYFAVLEYYNNSTIRSMPMCDIVKDRMFFERITHPGINSIILGTELFMDSAYFMTIFIPIMAWLVMPMVMYLFMFYFTKDSKISLLGFLFYIFGTYSFEAFLISAFWSQLFATIFMLLFIVFIEDYKSRGKKISKVLSFVCFLSMAAFHIKVAGSAIIYIIIRSFFERRYKQTAIWFAVVFIGVLIYPNVLVLNYESEVSVWFVLKSFVFPLLWLIAAIYCFKNRKVLTITEKTWVVFFVAVFVMSSQAALWRPLISVLPLVIYFATKAYADIANNKLMFYAASLITLVILLVFTFYTVSFAINNMIGEMIPGVFERTYRHMDPEPLLKMFSGSKDDISRISGNNVTIHKVTGFVSSLTGEKTETDEVIYGSE